MKANAGSTFPSSIESNFPFPVQIQGTIITAELSDVLEWFRAMPGVASDLQAVVRFARVHLVHVYQLNQPIKFFTRPTVHSQTSGQEDAMYVQR
jgi:hypothetical protein